MADLAARREARRKKILENSGNRLQRITGRNDSSNHEDNSSKFKNTDSDVNIPDRLPESNQSLENNSTISDEDFQRLVQNGVFRSYDNVIDDFNRAVRTNLPLRVQSTTPVLQKFFCNRFYYVLLAAIINILIVLNLNQYLGKAIIIPCFVTMLARILVCRNFQESQSNNLLIAALILCNIKPELIHKCKTVVTTFTIVMSDLSLYIFSFTLMYYAIRYLPNFNFTLSSSNYVQHDET